MCKYVLFYQRLASNNKNNLVFHHISFNILSLFFYASIPCVYDTILYTVQYSTVQYILSFVRESFLSVFCIIPERSILSVYSYNVCNIFLQEPHYLCMFCNLTEEMGYFWQCFILQYSRTLCSIPILYSSWGKNVLFLVVICNVTYTAVFYCSVECFAFCAGKVLKRSAFVSFPISENLIPPPTPATSAIWPTTLLKIQFDPLTRLCQLSDLQYS